jgi:hypothetical protein
MASCFLRPVVCAQSVRTGFTRLVAGRMLGLTLTCSAVLIFFGGSPAEAQVLRVVTYNIDADTGGAHGAMGGDISGPGLAAVLQAVGDEHLAGHAQPIDVLALEEVNYPSPTTTLDYIVGQLNGFYGAGTYAYDLLNDTTTGNFTGNGPSRLIYNTTTVQVLGSAVIGSASGSGAPRAPMRYKLAPKGYNDHSADFYLYVSHMKSGTDSSPGGDFDRRNIEANTIRTNAATLGASAHIIYSGDLNLTVSTEAAYQTMIGPGTGQAIDTLALTARPPNASNYWDTSSTYKDLLTEQHSVSGVPLVYYRDDFQLVTDPMLNQPGMKLLTNTLTSFGNGGNIYHKSVTDVANSTAPYIALADLANRSTVLTALTTATDHLPVVADYSFASAVGIPGDYNHSGLVDTADYTLWTTSFGSTTSLAADGNGDGIVDAADYAVWRDHLGTTMGAGAGAAVPEPSAAVLLIFGGCIAGLASVKLKG